MEPEFTNRGATQRVKNSADETGRSSAIPSEQPIGSLLLLACTVWFLCGSLMVMQDDSWWHLRTGEYIWETLTIPLTDSYSWVLSPGTFWPNHEWLAQLLYYFTYRAGSFLLVNLCGATIIFTTGYLLAKISVGSQVQRTAILIALLPWLVRALAVRPHIFTLLGIALLLYLLARDRLRPLPIVFLVWAQLHAGVVLGVGLLGATLVWSVLYDRTRFRRITITLIFSIIAVSLNPLGPYIFLYPLAPFKRIADLPLIEWLPPGFSDPLDLYFWGCAIAFIILTLVRWRRLAQWPTGPFVLCALSTLPFACEHARHIYLWFLIAGVATSHLIFTSERSPPELSLVSGSPGMRFHTTLRLSSLRHAALPLAVVSLSLWSLLHPPRWLGWQPVTAAGIKAVTNAPSPMFNSYGTGGFILWFVPTKKVFIDSRQDPYPSALLSEAMEAQRTGHFEDLFSRFGIRSAIVERPMPLVNALIAAGWAVTYDGLSFTVLVSPEAPPLTK